MKEKTENVNIRMTENVKARVVLRSIELGMTVSEYIRWLVMKDLEKK